MLQNATALRKSAPWLLTSLMNMSFVLRLPREMHLWRSSSNVPCLPSFLETLKTLTFCSLLTRCTIPCACHAKRALNVQKWSVGVIAISKVVRTWCVLYILTSKCVSRHSGVHFFDISTSKSGPDLLTSKCASRHNGVEFFNLSSGQMAPHPPL